MRFTFRAWLKRWWRALLAYVVLIIPSLVIAVGYVWLIITSFSTRTEGLRSLGWTLQNWRFLWESPFGPRVPSIWQVTLNTLVMSLIMTIIVVGVSSLAGYALARMKFPGRKGFLSLTLILHAFPSVTLLIPIYFVLSRFRVWWQIVMPNIKPGIAALSIFSFLTAWNAYLIPLTFTSGRAGRFSVLSLYVQNFISESVMTEWNAVAAVGLFQLIPVVLFFLFTQEALLNIYGGGRKGGV